MLSSQIGFEPLHESVVKSLRLEFFFDPRRYRCQWQNRALLPRLQFDNVNSHAGLERRAHLAHGQLVESDFFDSTDELSPANPTDITTFRLSRPLGVLPSQFSKIRSGNDAFVH